MWGMPGRHHELINPSDGSRFLTSEQAVDPTEAFEAEPLTLEAGKTLLRHNHLPHRSGGATAPILPGGPLMLALFQSR